AQYASVSQQAGLVPIVEPDVEFMEDADLARSAWVHEQAIARIYERCRIHGVLLEGSLIKPSFPQPGMKHPSRESVTPEEIALATATTISRSVPSAVPGVVFLSGGLPASVATSYLGAVNKLVNEAGPESLLARLQPLTFSFGRALQGDAAKSWVKGDEEGMKEAFEMWSRACWLAAQGKTA
ncbi:Fructose-bisphosphate aldolase A, partial [Termitomyces sp. T112]